MDDFERERRAREDHAESIRILEDRKKELEVENRNFKGQLTRYAAQNMRQEQEDEVGFCSQRGYSQSMI